MAQLLAAYDRVLQRRPIVVKTLTSAALFGLGDAMSQKLEGKDVRAACGSAAAGEWCYDACACNGAGPWDESEPVLPGPPTLRPHALTDAFAPNVFLARSSTLCAWAAW